MSVTRQLRQLLERPGLIRALAPHDVFSAKVAESAGIELLFLGGFGVSASVFGWPDLGLTTLSEMTEAVRRMTDRLTVPLIADGDTGHGELPNVARTVRDFERAGAAGLLLEDQVSPKRCGHFAGKSVISCEAMLDKLRVALDTRRDDNFVVVARTDARAVEGLDAAIERAQRYAELGADVCFVEAPEARDELARIASAIRVPQLANMLPGGKTPLLSAEDLEQLGFKIAVDPIATLLATGAAVRRVAQTMQRDANVERMSSEMMTFGEVKQLLGLEEFQSTGDRATAGAREQPWRSQRWQAQAQLLLDSYRRWLGRDLIDRQGSRIEQARRLFEAPFVVVSHGTQADPILNYGNRQALDLWQMSVDVLEKTPSRTTAEPMHRDERAQLLERTRRDGYADNYQGIRISSDGRRFRIFNALVWNLIDATGQYAGQAATFSNWQFL